MILWLCIVNWKKNAPYKNCELSFIQGLTEDYSLGSSLSVKSLRELLLGSRGRSQLHTVFCLGNTGSQTCVCVLSCFSPIQLFATLSTVAWRAPMSIGFSRQEYWRGLPCPPPVYFPVPGVELRSLMSPKLANSKASAYTVGDLGSSPGSGRSSGEGNGKPLQYSCLENPMDRGARQATVHWVAKSRTQPSDFTSLLYVSCHLGSP